MPNFVVLAPRSVSGQLTRASVLYRLQSRTAAGNYITVLCI